jgi:hypothetical protein
MIDQQDAGMTMTAFSPSAFKASRIATAAPHPAHARWPRPKFSDKGIFILFIKAPSSFGSQNPEIRISKHETKFKLMAS